MKKTACLIVLLPSLSFAAIGSRVKPSQTLVLELLKLPSEVRIDAITRQPDPVYDTLLEVARTKDHPMNIRWRAVTSAALIKREKAVPDLLALSESSEWYLRNASLVSLSEVAPKESVTLARRLVKDPALVVRSAAVDVIGKHASESERDLLWDEFQADYNRRGAQSLWIRGQILKTLAQHAKATEQDRFLKLLSEKDLEIQKASMQALEKITGLKVARDASSHERAVQLWKNHLSRQPSSKLQR